MYHTTLYRYCIVTWVTTFIRLVFSRNGSGGCVHFDYNKRFDLFHTLPRKRLIFVWLIIFIMLYRIFFTSLRLRYFFNPILLILFTRNHVQGRYLLLLYYKVDVFRLCRRVTSGFTCNRLHRLFMKSKVVFINYSCQRSP